MFRIIVGRFQKLRHVSAFSTTVLKQWHAFLLAYIGTENHRLSYLSPPHALLNSGRLKMPDSCQQTMLAKIKVAEMHMTDLDAANPVPHRVAGCDTIQPVLLQ